VRVHHDEGVANRIDPESCADAREGIGEALGAPRRLGVVVDTGMCGRSWHGNREISWSASASIRAALVRVGRARSRSR
jgi:hypothetical protein